MKTYICDACLKPISDPYTAQMREFYIGAHIDEFGVWPCEARHKRKLHICNECLTDFKRFIRCRGLTASQLIIDEMNIERDIVNNDDPNKLKQFSTALCRAYDEIKEEKE